MLNESIRLLYMTKRLQVLLHEEDYRTLQQSARNDRMTIAEWVRQALRETMSARQRAVKDKLRAMDEAMKCEHPTADIEVMNAEIEDGYRQMAQ